MLDFKQILDNSAIQDDIEESHAAQHNYDLLEDVCTDFTDDILGHNRCVEKLFNGIVISPSRFGDRTCEIRASHVMNSGSVDYHYHTNRIFRNVNPHDVFNLFNSYIRRLCNHMGLDTQSVNVSMTEIPNDDGTYNNK